MTEQTKSIADQIDILIELQKLDSEIYKLTEEKEGYPADIALLKEEFNSKQTGLKAAEENYKKLQVSHKEKEVELKAKEESIKKYQAQLYQVKTNKEYSSLQHEIEGIKADSSLIEEDIIKLLDELDKAKSAIDKEKEKLKEEESKLKESESKINTRVKEIEKRLEELGGKRKEVVPGLDKKLVSKYERVLNNRSGLALVPVVHDACGGCHLNLPPQVINEIAMSKEIIVCESCARILYLPKEASSDQSG